MPSFVKKIIARFEGQPVIGGLEISDSTLRFAIYKGRTWRITSVRLPPGVVEGGQIKKRDEFINALRGLHREIGGRREKIGVIVSLSSLSVYSQVFTLPLVSGENLRKAIELNLQMSSPADVAQVYAGWQMVNEDVTQSKLEILSAFAQRHIIDDLRDALRYAGFVVVAIEFRALSLARVLRELSIDLDVRKPYIVFNVDDMGLDFLIVRHGELYFEYYNSWRDLHKDRFLPLSNFEELIVANLYRVINFYNQHWTEPLEAIILMTSNLHDEIEQIIKANFPLTIRELKLKIDQSVNFASYTALGSGVRGLMPRRDDGEISLSGIQAQEEFRREQIAHFIHFWRVLVPAVFIFLTFMLIGADFFLGKIEVSLEPQIHSTAQGRNEVQALEEQAQRFNASVALVKTIRAALRPKEPVLDRVMKIVAQNNITLQRFNFGGTAVSISGSAGTQEKVLEFKKALESSPDFQNIALPLNAIQCVGQECVFSMTFSINPASSLNTK